MKELQRNRKWDRDLILKRIIELTGMWKRPKQTLNENKKERKREREKERKREREKREREKERKRECKRERIKVMLR